MMTLHERLDECAAELRSKRETVKVLSTPGLRWSPSIPDILIETYRLEQRYLKLREILEWAKIVNLDWDTEWDEETITWFRFAFGGWPE